MTTNWYLGETRDYSMFNFVNSNRDINKVNLKKIEASILEIGIQVPIVVNSNYEIIEGQHRFTALKNHKLPVPYIVSKSANENQISKLQESRKWSALDYCKSYASKGNTDCIQALEIADKWIQNSNGKMSVIKTLELLLDGAGVALMYRLKRNQFTINLECANNVFDCVKVMSTLETGTNPFGNKIVRALKKLHYDYGELRVDVIHHMTKKNYIQAYSNENDQLKYLKNLYNKSLKALK